MLNRRFIHKGINVASYWRCHAGSQSRLTLPALRPFLFLLFYMLFLLALGLDLLLYLGIEIEAVITFPIRIVIKIVPVILVKEAVFFKVSSTQSRVIHVFLEHLLLLQKFDIFLC